MTVLSLLGVGDTKCCITGSSICWRRFSSRPRGFFSCSLLNSVKIRLKKYIVEFLYSFAQLVSTPEILTCFTVKDTKTRQKTNWKERVPWSTNYMILSPSQHNSFSPAAFVKPKQRPPHRPVWLDVFSSSAMWPWHKIKGDLLGERNENLPIANSFDTERRANVHQGQTKLKVIETLFYGGLMATFFFYYFSFFLSFVSIRNSSQVTLVVLATAWNIQFASGALKPLPPSFFFSLFFHCHSSPNLLS